MAKTEEENRLHFFLRRMETEYRAFLKNELNTDLDVTQIYRCQLTFPYVGTSIERMVEYDYDQCKWVYQGAFPEQKLIDLFVKKTRQLKDKSKGFQIYFQLSLNTLGYFSDDHFTIV